VDVHIATATDGAAGSIDANWQGDRNRLAEARAEELKAATQVLGAELHMFGFRDSGYIGDPANGHPEAFKNVDDREAAGRVVALIRRFRPQVVVTHDETGGTYHPDHIKCNRITTIAFHAAGDPEQYPEIGLEPYQPERLYYGAFSNRWIKVFTAVMRLRGKDPTRGGRNQDVDYTKFGVDPSKITTSINYRDYWDVRLEASAQHSSQGGGTTFIRLLPRSLQMRLLAKDTFIRAFPPTLPGYREKDLFES
jgi:LmbE family N-acetylglucosaminyl deacetylase